MKENISKIDVAEMQLKAAIKLFLNDRDYYSALTLGAAGEEIVGAMLQKKIRKAVESIGES